MFLLQCVFAKYNGSKYLSHKTLIASNIVFCMYKRTTYLAGINERALKLLLDKRGAWTNIGKGENAQAEDKNLKSMIKANLWEHFLTVISKRLL